MTLPTTQKECTTRRIAVLISGLWTKIKNGFVQFSSVGAASGVASLDSNGKVPSSQMPEGIYSDSAEFYTWKPDRRDNSPLSATSGICRSGRGMDPVTYSAGTWLCINVSNGFSNGVVTLYMATHSEANPVTYVVVVSAFRYGRHTIYVKGNQRSGYQRHINKFYLKTDDGQQAFVYFKLESESGRLLLVSSGFESGREAGMTVGTLKKTGLTDELAGKVTLCEGVSAEDVAKAIELLNA